MYTTSINREEFIVRYLQYCICSFILLVFTSTGFLMLANILAYGGGLLIAIVLQYIATLYQRRKNINYILFPQRIFYILLGVQFLIILFNPGDCYDGEGRFLFIERILGIGECNQAIEPIVSENIHTLIFYVSKVIYFVVLASIIAVSFLKSMNTKQREC